MKFQIYIIILYKENFIFIRIGNFYKFIHWLNISSHISGYGQQAMAHQYPREIHSHWDLFGIFQYDLVIIHPESNLSKDERMVSDLNPLN